MSTPKAEPRLGARGSAEAAAREQRRGEALRRNLAKRKQQARARADEDPTGTGGEELTGGR